MVSYLNHTPCLQHDHTATKAMDIVLYLLIIAQFFQIVTLLQTRLDHFD